MSSLKHFTLENELNENKDNIIGKFSDYVKKKLPNKVPDSLFWQISAEADFRYTSFFEPAHTGPKVQGPRTKDQ